MLGILVQLAFSWLLVWVFQKKGLGVLGFRPTAERIRSFFFFLILTALICASGYFLHMAFGARWKLNPASSLMTVLNGLWWHFRSVIFEELIFRGVLLYILIKRIGPKPAIIISAISFGIYHWFSFEQFGQPVNMIITFLSTGAMGLLQAYAYSKTFSLYIPVAIHFGWNGMAMIFSNGPIGNYVFIPDQPAYIVTLPALIGYLVIFTPLIIALFVNFLLLKRKPQAVEDSVKR